MAIYDAIINNPQNTQAITSFAKGTQTGQQFRANQLDQQAKQMANFQALNQDIAHAAIWAKTPEKWNQVVDHFVNNGIAGAEKYRDRFDLRDAVIASAQNPNQTGLPYYAVPTSSGYVMINKKTGETSMMQTPVGAGENIMPPKTSVAGQPTSYPPAKPLLPISADPAVKGEVAGAEASAKADVKRREENLSNAISLETRVSPLNRLRTTAKELLSSAGLESRTGLSSYIPAVLQGEDARNTEAKMTVLKSQVAQNVLQMYRNMSQTGGAVGQVSNFEQEMFQNNLAALDEAQGADQFEAELNKIIEFADGSEQRMKNAIKWQSQGLSVEDIMKKLYPAQAPQDGGAPKVGDVMDGYKFLGGDPADPNSWEQQ